MNKLKWWAHIFRSIRVQTVGLSAHWWHRTAIAWRTLLLACKSWRRASRRGECLLPNLFSWKLRQLRQDTRHSASSLVLPLGLKRNPSPSSEMAQTAAKCRYCSPSALFPCWSVERCLGCGLTPDLASAAASHSQLPSPPRINFSSSPGGWAGPGSHKKKHLKIPGHFCWIKKPLWIMK